MTDWCKRGWTAAAAGALMLGAAAPALAGEADDLQRMIETQKSQVSTLEKLDAQGIVKEELTYMRVWLDDAWRFRGEEEFDRAREIIDRCSAQTEMVQKKLDAAKASAAAIEHETALKQLKDKVAKTKAAIAKAQVEKKAMEMNIK